MARSKQFRIELENFYVKTSEKLEKVYKRSVERMLEMAQKPVLEGGRMPVLTGALRRSLTAQIDGGFTVTGAESYKAAAAQLKLGDEVKFTWNIFYAPYQEFGTDHGIRPKLFVSTAVANWSTIVEQEALLLAD